MNLEVDAGAPELRAGTACAPSPDLATWRCWRARSAPWTDRLPLCIRDHLQDRYLEALGVRFAPSAEAGAGEGAGDIGASLRALERSIGRWLNR